MARLHDWFIETMINTLREKNFDLENTEKLNDIVSTVVGNSAPEASNVILKSLKANAGEMLQEHFLIRQEFEARLLRRWAKPLNMLEMLIVISLESAEMLLSNDDFVTSQEHSFLFQVLANIHARAIQISYEILCLLRGGYPDGALARWRTLYELAIVALFLDKHGNEVAERYFGYQAIENYREMLEYQLHCEQLGYEPLEPDEISEVEKQRKNAIDKYGPEFNKDYGWAIAALRKKKVIFKDLEDEVELDHMRPYYKLACNFVHSGPKGAYFKMGLIDNHKANELMVSGASNYGLADAGQNTCLSLTQITNCLLSLQPTFDSIVTMKIMTMLIKEICDSFVQVQRDIEEEEKSKIRKFRIKNKSI
ncbi:MAG TPA: DUF5677 domain-containing protein [Syntrophomonadaceae bacterium]|nr:DUF5677 domain-containing protein [Syntrophomonadaceae bacterium]